MSNDGRYIDTTFAFTKGGGDQIGPTKRGKGVKILEIVDRHGLPLLAKYRKAAGAAGVAVEV